MSVSVTPPNPCVSVFHRLHDTGCLWAEVIMLFVDVTKFDLPQEALRVKISRERVGEELDKMMGGKICIAANSLSSILKLVSRSKPPSLNRPYQWFIAIFLGLLRTREFRRENLWSPFSISIGPPSSHDPPCADEPCRCIHGPIWSHLPLAPSSPPTLVVGDLYSSKTVATTISSQRFDPISRTYVPPEGQGAASGRSGHPGGTEAGGPVSLSGRYSCALRGGRDAAAGRCCLGERQSR